MRLSDGAWATKLPTLRLMLGMQQVEHAYFYAVHGADEPTRLRYLGRAYQLGRDFEASL